MLNRLFSRQPEPPPEAPVPNPGPEVQIPPLTIADGPYESALEHLADELAVLELAIRQRLRRIAARGQSDPLQQLRGLVLSEHEVRDLLSATDDDTGSPELATARRQVAARRAESRAQGLELPLDRLSRLFELSALDELALIVALAPEIDRKYEKLYAYLHDDVTRKRPSVDLVLALAGLRPAERLVARRRFAPGAPLVDYRLAQVLETPAEAPLPLIGRALALDERIADLLLDAAPADGDPAACAARLDPRLAAVARLELARHEIGLPTGLAAQVRGFVHGRPAGGVVWVHGPYGSGKRALATAAAVELGRPLLIAQADKLLAEPATLGELFWRLAREACLQPAVLCLEGCDGLAETQAMALAAGLEAAEKLSPLTFLLATRPWRPAGRPPGAFLAVALEPPGNGERTAVWQQATAGAELGPDVALGELASMFRFTPGQIRDALGAARDLARWRDPEGDGRVGARDLLAACRAQSSPALARLARRIEPRRTWGDLVLPPDTLAHLRELCVQARYRHVVLGDWGFERKLTFGKGLAALFSGPPGTGKTMAAEVVAGELGLDLYKIDLSQVVSKYIGETEKNLDRIFTAAEEGNAILFFDEADALFGKRSEVRDSHDRYANVEISYLLQKMEEHEGISILATNLRQNLDSAFLRRLQAIVEMPFPDAADRERIWRVTFPSEAPLGEDVDFALLGRDLRLAGGDIKNVGMNAAYQAAAQGGVVHMGHLAAAARREHQKLGRLWTEPAWVQQALDATIFVGGAR